MRTGIGVTPSFAGYYFATSLMLNTPPRFFTNIPMGNKIGSGCKEDKRAYPHSISSALSVNSAVNLTMSSYKSQTEKHSYSNPLHFYLRGR